MPVQFAKAETDTAPAIANVVGDFQSKIGDSDWNINSDKTVMTYKGNGFYEFTTPVALPAGDYEYKVALNHSWEGGGVPSQGNLSLHLDSDSVVTFITTIILQVLLILQNIHQFRKKNFQEL